MVRHSPPNLDMGPGGTEAKKPSMEQRTEEAEGGTRLGAEMLLQFGGWGGAKGGCVQKIWRSQQNYMDELVLYSFT